MAISVTAATLIADLQRLMDDENAVWITTARGGAFINRALDHVHHMAQAWSARPFSTKNTVTLVANTREYTIAGEVRTIDKVTILRSDGTERLIAPVDFKDAEAIADASPNTSNLAPLYYYRKQLKVGFLPTPTEAGTAYVYTQTNPDDISSTTALTLPPFFRNLIVFKAAEIAAASKGDSRQMRNFQELYAGEKIELEMLMASWQQQESDLVRPLWDYEWHVYAGTA